ncbi:MAG: hypothetical protein WDN28_20670 [Chthoniobacter sp.]
MKGFAWQDGYGAFAVSKSNLPTLTAYIGNQREHHRTKTFKEEFVALLVRHGLITTKNISGIEGKRRSATDASDDGDQGLKALATGRPSLRDSGEFSPRHREIGTGKSVSKRENAAAAHAWCSPAASNRATSGRYRE